MALLYHYTTAAGLKGIVEGRSVWASDYRFLNDSQEFRHGILMFEAVLQSRSADTQRVYDGELLWAVKDAISALSDPRQYARNTISVFIASFSNAPDLLSQWRGYNGGKGYSLGMDYDWLADCARINGFGLSPVHYEQGTQEKILNARIDLLLQLCKQSPSEQMHSILQTWFQLLFQSISCCKHPSFAEEQEYRAVLIGNGWPNKVRTRPSPGGLIPYMDIELVGKRPSNYTNHENNLGFEHIIIGPALHDRQISAVDAMLAPLKMRFSVTKSAIPFVAE